jgi:hypothetical protein
MVPVGNAAVDGVPLGPWVFLGPVGEEPPPPPEPIVTEKLNGPENGVEEVR